MNKIIADFLQKDVGSVLISDAEGNFIYPEYQVLSEKAKAVWKNSVPQPASCQKGEVWEFLDAGNQKYYRVTTSSFMEENGFFQIHHLVDITEYTDVFKNISALSTQWEEMSRFQSTILKNLSGEYTAIIPDIARLFCTDEVMLFVRTKSKAYRLIFTMQSKENIKSVISREDEAFSLRAGDCCHDFICFLNETADKMQYCLLLKQGKTFKDDKLQNVMVQSAIRLYIENGLLKSQIIYESEHDHMTGLYNKGKYLSLLQAQFGKPQTIAVYNMDVNNLKTMNDTYGHEMGDKLIVKAARSLLMMETEQIMGFRMGGDEFMMIAVDQTLEEANAIKSKWEDNVEALNQESDGIPLVIACGMAYGLQGYELEELLKEADALMYEDKKRKKSTAVV